MLDLSFVQELIATFIERVARCRVEDFFLDLGVDGQCGTYLLEEIGIVAVLLFLFFVLCEQRLDLVVVGFEQSDGVLGFRAGAPRFGLSGLTGAGTNGHGSLLRLRW
jgi:hypothetical protein